MTRQALLLTLLLAGCAASPEPEERQSEAETDIEAILTEPSTVEDYVDVRRCLSAHEYRDFRVLDDRYILFVGRGDKLWLNTLRMRCPDLRHAEVLQVRSVSAMGRICDMDSFRPSDWLDRPWYRHWPWRWGTRGVDGMVCTLGEFQQVTAAQVAAIEAALR